MKSPSDKLTPDPDRLDRLADELEQDGDSENAELVRRAAEVVRAEAEGKDNASSSTP